MRKGYNRMSIFRAAADRLNSRLQHFSPITLWLFGIADATVTIAILGLIWWGAK